MRTKVFGSLFPHAAWLFTAIISLLIPSASLLAQSSLFDSSFAVGSGANGIVYSIVVQTDGKILVGGDFTQIAGQTNLYLARLSPDGQVDQTFAGGTDGPVYRLLQQPDGKILVAGAFTNVQGVLRRGVGRLLTNGVVDLSIDAGDFLGSNHTAFALGLQPDQKILVGTIHQSVGGGLFRLNPNGQIDGSFIQTNFFNQHYIFAITPRTNGSILVGGGFQGVNSFSTPGLALITTNGVLDTTLNPLLKTNSSFFDASGVYSIAVLPDSSFLIGGRFWQQGFTNRSVIGKLTSSLGWDGSFQPDAFDPLNEYSSGIGIVMSSSRQPDGKFVLGGLFQEVGGYWRRNIVRVDSQGKVDPCFDSGIGLAANTQSGNGGVWVITVQPDGEIIAGGGFFNFLKTPMATLSSSNLTRLLPQSDCGVTRVHLGNSGPGQDFVLATCVPGGTNHLQVSTNLVDWITTQSTSFPYLFFNQMNVSTLEGSLFFRVKKEY